MSGLDEQIKFCSCYKKGPRFYWRIRDEQTRVVGFLSGLNATKERGGAFVGVLGVSSSLNEFEVDIIDLAKYFICCICHCTFRKNTPEFSILIERVKEAVEKEDFYLDDEASNLEEYN